MKRTLLLTSQGISKELKEVFLSLLPKPPPEIKVSFITTSAYGEEEDASWLEEYRKQLRECGITQIEDLDVKDKTKNELEYIFKDKDIVFVNGGNTYYLLKYIRESGFDNVLPQLLDQGKLYIGVSAGSIVVGPSIELAGWNYGTPDINRVNLTDLRGLSLVPFAVCPHFTETDRPYIEPYTKTVSYPIYVLNDTQAVLVQNDTYTIVGKGEKILYNSHNE